MHEAALKSNPDAVRQSLKFKGYLFNVLLLSYIVFILLFALSQREQPLEQLEQYQKIQRAQEALLQADLAAFHIVTVLFSQVSQADLNNVVGYFSSLRQQYINLQRWFPEQAETFKTLVDSIPGTLQEPNEDNLRDIQFHLARSKSVLDRLMKVNQERLGQLVADYRERNDSTVLAILVLGIVGLVILGGLISFFIKHLRKDIDSLHRRTSEIVDGYRGEPLAVRRNDEVGQLTRGVNFMAKALSEREQALEIQYNKASFVEKMVAIDSLAAGIAHEFGNPIASIAGLVDVIKSDENNSLSKESRQSLESLLGYTNVLVRLTRDLAVFDAQKGDEFEWLDINQVITNTCQIFHYDKRWSNVNIDLRLNHSIPAVFGSGNQVIQLVNNILENSMYALRDVECPEVSISTQLQGAEHILIQIRDNGSGMEQEVLDHVFDPFFSTKPVGQGTGLGLAICWTIVKNHYGIIRAQSADAKGCEISIVLPFNGVDNAE
jgi:signal transduction histidine kinase